MVVRKRDCAPATQVNALDCLAVVSTEQLQTNSTATRVRQRDESDESDSSGADSHEDSYGGIGRKAIRSWSNARFTSDELIASSLAGLRESDDDDAYRSSKRRRVRFEANSGGQDASVFAPRCRAEQDGHAISQYLQQTMQQVAKLNLELTSLAPMIYSSGFLSCDQQRGHRPASPQPSVQYGSDSGQGEVLAETQRINATLETLLHRMLVPLATASPQSFPSLSQASTTAQPEIELLHQVHAQLLTLEAHLRGSVGFDLFVVRMRPILESLWNACRSNVDQAQRHKQMVWKAKAEGIYKQLKSALLNSKGNSSLAKQLLDTMEDADKLVFDLERNESIDDNDTREQPLVNAVAALRSAFYEMEARRWSSQAAVDMESTQSSDMPDNVIDPSASTTTASATNSQQPIQTPATISDTKAARKVVRTPKQAQGKIPRRVHEAPLPKSVKRKNAKLVTAAAPAKSVSVQAKTTDASGSSSSPTKATRRSTLSMGALAARDATKSTNAPPAKSNYATRGRSAAGAPQVLISSRGVRSASGSSGTASENRSGTGGSAKQTQRGPDSPVFASTGAMTAVAAGGAIGQKESHSDGPITINGSQRQGLTPLAGGHAASPSSLVFSVLPKPREILPRADTTLKEHTHARNSSVTSVRVDSASSADASSGERAGSTPKPAPPQYFPAMNVHPSQVTSLKVTADDSHMMREGINVSIPSTALPLRPVGWSDLAASSSTDDDSEPKENEAFATNTKRIPPASSRRRGRLAGCAVCLKNNSYHALLLCDNECGREYHTFCLDPKLDKIPEGEWYCPECIQEEGVKDHQIFKCSALNCWKITGAKYCSLHRCRHSNCLNRLKAAGFCRRHEAHRAQPKKLRPRAAAPVVGDPAQSGNLKDEELSRTELVPRVDLRSDGRLAGTAS